MTLNDEVAVKRNEAITWLIATLSLMAQRDEALGADDEAGAKFYAQAVSAAIMSLDLMHSHIAMSVMLEALGADFAKQRTA